MGVEAAHDKVDTAANGLNMIIKLKLPRVMIFVRIFPRNLLAADNKGVRYCTLQLESVFRVQITAAFLLGFNLILYLRNHMPSCVVEDSRTAKANLGLYAKDKFS